MKRQYILGLVSGIAISSVLVVNAAQTNTTIESCAQLLPPDETFELDINGKIDTNGQNPFFPVVSVYRMEPKSSIQIVREKKLCLL